MSDQTVQLLLTVGNHQGQFTLVQIFLDLPSTDNTSYMLQLLTNR